MDVSPFAIDTASRSDTGVWCALRHPGSGAGLTWNGRPVRVLVAGPDGGRFRAACRRAAESWRDDGARARDADAEVEIECRLLAELTLDWENLTRADGVALAHSPAVAVALYRDLPWLRAQVAAFAGDRAHFIAASGSG